MTSAFIFNSRPSDKFPLDWFIRNLKMGGFANTKSRRECNAKFETIGDNVYVVSTKPIGAGEEVIVFYRCLHLEKLEELKLEKLKKLSRTRKAENAF
jgi:hypothetical protein